MKSSRHHFPLNPTFFGLTFNLKNLFLEEYWVCMEIFNMSYKEVLDMPVYVRKFMIGLKIKERQKESEKFEMSQKKGGYSKISGDTLKNKINNNEIPT